MVFVQVAFRNQRVAGFITPLEPTSRVMSSVTYLASQSSCLISWRKLVSIYAMPSWRQYENKTIQVMCQL